MPTKTDGSCPYCNNKSFIYSDTIIIKHRINNRSSGDSGSMLVQGLEEYKKCASCKMYCHHIEIRTDSHHEMRELPNNHTSVPNRYTGG